MSKKESIKLYGEIDCYGENSSREFINRFTQIENNADEIEIHIHSVGGDVFEGNVIYNTIKNSKKRVVAYIDGIAASMASVIMLACEKIYMADNAFVMIHAPSCFLQGTSEDFKKAAKLLKNMEDNFVKAYSQRTKKKEAQVREWLKGDNWFSAQEALEEGLIDGITEQMEIEDMEKEEVIRKSTAEGLLRNYRMKIQENRIINNIKKEKEMTKEKKVELIKKWGLQGVSPESTEEEIENAITAKMQHNEKALAEEKHKQIVAKVESAINEKKISDKQKESYIEIGEKMGLDKLCHILDEMKAIQEIKPSITSQIISDNGTGIQNRSDWDWDKYQKEDPRGLERLRIEDKEEFDRLYKAKYNNK